MNTFTLPTKSQIHLCLGQREARALSDLIELHFLREEARAAGMEPDPLTEKELKQTISFGSTDLAKIELGIIQEMRNCGWSIS